MKHKDFYMENPPLLTMEIKKNPRGLKLLI